MPVFQYKAMKDSGDVIAGIMDADSPKDARTKLRSQNLHVTEMELLEQGAKKKGLFSLPAMLSRKRLYEIALITRQLATLLDAGIQLNEALNALVEQVESRPLASALRDIREKIGSGTTFADALANHPAYFSDLYVNMVRAGEASGNLDVVLARLADYIQSQHRLQARVMAALTYPIVMLVIGVGVVAFLLTFVVPKILVVLKSQKAALPLPTEILIAVCAVVTQFWWLFIIVFFGLWVFKRVFVSTPKGRLAYDSMLLRLPVLGELFRKQAVSRFASTFAALLESGIPAVEALGIAKSVTGNMVLSNCLDEVRQRIIQGSNIAGPLKKSKVFPPVMGYMVAVGEESGRLEQLLRKVAEAYDEEIEVTTQKVTAMLEPVLIVVMATVVGFIVLSILLPIIEMSKLG